MAKTCRTAGSSGSVDGDAPVAGVNAAAPEPVVAVTADELAEVEGTGPTSPAVPVAAGVLLGKGTGQKRTATAWEDKPVTCATGRA